MLIHYYSMAVTHQYPCLPQVRDADLVPAKIKMHLLSAFGHFGMCAKDQLIFKCLLCCSLITLCREKLGGFLGRNLRVF